MKEGKKNRRREGGKMKERKERKEGKKEGR